MWNGKSSKKACGEAPVPFGSGNSVLITHKSQTTETEVKWYYVWDTFQEIMLRRVKKHPREWKNIFRVYKRCGSKQSMPETQQQLK